MPNIKPAIYADTKTIIESECIHEKLSEAIIQMVTTGYLPYYAEFMQYVNFYKSNIGTCGVSVNNDGMNFYWDKEYVDKLTVPECVFIIIHEAFHLLLNHHKRSVGYNKKIANLAADMIINSMIHGDIMVGEKLGDYNEDINGKYVGILSIPKDEFGNNSCIFIPKEYDGEPMLEDLYDWLMVEYDKWSEKTDKKKLDYISMYGKNGISRTDNGKKFDNLIDMYDVSVFFDNIDSDNGQSLDVHLDDEVPPIASEEWVSNVMDKLKNRGLETSNMVTSLNKLRKSKEDYLKHIKRKLSSEILGSIQHKTITRPNRRSIDGLKGKRKYKCEINVILDTSMSMMNEFDKLLSYIFSRDIKIRLTQCDKSVKYDKIITKLSQLEHMPIKGMGGTVLMPAVDLIRNDANRRKLNLVILTDGYTDVLDFSSIVGNILIISSGILCKTKNSDRVKQIIINKRNE